MRHMYGMLRRGHIVPLLLYIILVRTSITFASPSSSPTSTSTPLLPSSSTTLDCVKKSISPYLKDTLCDIYELKKGKRIPNGYVPGICCEPWVVPLRRPSSSSSSFVITVNATAVSIMPPMITTTKGGTIDYTNLSIPVTAWNIPFGCRICPSEPILDNHYVSRSFYIRDKSFLSAASSPSSSDDSKVKLYGHFSTLSNPVDHFSVLVPKNSCTTTTSTSSSADLYYPHEIITEQAHWSRTFRLERNIPNFHKTQDTRYTVQIRSHSHGCRIATNGGLFNTETGACYGNVISNQQIRSISTNRNAQFGYYSQYDTKKDRSRSTAAVPSPSSVVSTETSTKKKKNGKNTDKKPSSTSSFATKSTAPKPSSSKPSFHHYLMTGYFGIHDIDYLTKIYNDQQENNELLPSTGDNPSFVVPTDPSFIQLIGGATWLVRNGTNYALTSAVHIEDSTVQETSSSMENFALTLSGRTAIGINKHGQLILAQLDGRSWWNGINLPTFADWLIGMDVQSAINLDGGGSTVWLTNNEITNNPTYGCPSVTGKDTTVTTKTTRTTSGSTHPPPARRNMRGFVNAEPTDDNEEGERTTVSSTNTGTAPLASDPNQDGSPERNYHCPRKISSLVCVHAVPRIPTIIPTVSLSDEDYDEGTVVQWDQWKILLTNGCVCSENDNEIFTRSTSLLPLSILYDLVQWKKHPSLISGSTGGPRNLREEQRNNQLCLCTPPSSVKDKDIPTEHYTVAIIDTMKESTGAPSKAVTPSKVPTPTKTVPASISSSSPVPYDDEDDTWDEASPSSSVRPRSSTGTRSSSSSSVPDVSSLPKEKSNENVAASRATKPSSRSSPSTVTAVPDDDDIFENDIMTHDF